VADDRVVMSNRGTIEAGGIDVAPSDFVKYDGIDWSIVDLAGRHPGSFYNDELVKPDAPLTVVDAP